MGWRPSLLIEGSSKAMSTENESSMTSCINGRTISIAGGFPPPERSFSPSLFRPWALGFIGLAISVALWGFGYKISRYNPHPDAASRTLLAKMWDKHQDVTQVSGVTQASAQPQLQFELLAALFLLGQPPTPAECSRRESDGPKCIPAHFRSVVPLRSPPIDNLSA